MSGRAIEEVGAAASVVITIDGREVEARQGATVLQAALGAGLYVPHLCFHPALGPSRGARPVDVVYRADEPVAGTRNEDAAFAGCGLCVVSVDGVAEPVPSCDLVVVPGMVVTTNTPALTARRRSRLAAILATHPHACLTCAQKEGCSREPCSTSVPLEERCCALLGHCELEKVADYIGIPPETPRYVPRGLAAVTTDPLFAWRPELCIGCLRCVRACVDLKGVEALGFVLRGDEVVVGETAPGRALAECRFCGACVEVCPTGTLTDRVAGGADRARRLVPCRYGCPAGMDVPRFLRAVAEDRLEDALAVVLDRLPLPHSLGRVCFHPCEAECRRSDLAGGLSVCRVRRQVLESVPPSSLAWSQPEEAGGRVAVIGAGPAGLAAAHFLRRLGHGVTVFEAAPEAGGMLRYGIPEYRLPAAMLQRDLKLLLEQGVEIRTGMALGRDVDLASLKVGGFDAVLIAVGAGAAKRLDVDGAGLAGVTLGVDFLRDVALGRLNAGALSGRRVVVVGGGNVAIDAARSALRLGARAVTVACLEALADMPAYAPEIDAATAEGVALLPSWGVGEIRGENGWATAVALIRCLAVFDQAGRFSPSYDPGVRSLVEADTVVLAIGQEVDDGFLEACAGKVSLAAGGVLPPDVGELGPGLPRVFSCGDVSLGPSSVVRSVASGRAAAEGIARYLGGSGDVPSILPPETPFQRLGREEGFAGRARVIACERDATARREDFGEVEATLGGEAARAEAARCLQCDLRLQLAQPVLPPSPWRVLEPDAIAEVPAGPGVYQLLGDDRVAVKITGVPDLRAALEDELAREPHPPYFTFHEDPMYTKRESELIQVFLGRHSRMPEGGDELDDLF